MSTLYLHIGFPKTATTFLQDVVLPEIRSINCFSKPTVRLGDRAGRFGTRFYFSPALWRERGKELLSQVIGPEPEGEAPADALISDEGFGGGITAPHPWSRASRPRQDRENGPYSTRAHLEELGQVAREWGFSRLRVIMGIRRQDEKLASGYAQVSDKVRAASQKNFERWIRRVLDPDRGYYEGGGVHHNYFLFWQRITEAVGAENMLVLPLEQLRENRATYLGRLFAFLEIREEGKAIVSALSESEEPNSEKPKSKASEVNVSEVGVSKVEASKVEDLKRNARSTAKDTWRLRTPISTGPQMRPWRLFRAWGLPKRLSLQWPDLRRETEIRLTPELKAYILGVYADENQRLDLALPDVDLRSYGYWPSPVGQHQDEQTTSVR